MICMVMMFDKCLSCSKGLMYCMCKYIVNKGYKHFKGIYFIDFVTGKEEFVLSKEQEVHEDFCYFICMGFNNRYRGKWESCLGTCRFLNKNIIKKILNSNQS